MKPLPKEDLEHILEHTRSIWEGVRGKSIFISGGTGFFGLWLLESLAYCDRRLRLGVSATVLTRDAAKFSAKAPHLTTEGPIRLHRGDVRDCRFPEGHFDYIIHAAAPTTGVVLANQFDLLNTLLDGTRRMIAFAESCSAKQFLLVSSGAVYGPQQENMTHIPEDYRGGPSWLDPLAAYAEGKRVAELMCATARMQSNIGFRIARCFAFVGPHLPLDQHFAIGNFINDAIAGREIKIRGDGTPERSYLYAADLAIWLWTLLLSEPIIVEPFPVVNVGSEEAIGILDLAKVVAAEVNPAVGIEVSKEPVHDRPPLRYIPDVQRANTLFGLRQSISLRDAIRRTAVWYQ